MHRYVRRSINGLVGPAATGYRDGVMRLEWTDNGIQCISNS